MGIGYYITSPSLLPPNSSFLTPSPYHLQATSYNLPSTPHPALKTKTNAIIAALLVVILLLGVAVVTMYLKLQKEAHLDNLANAYFSADSTAQRQAILAAAKQTVLHSQLSGISAQANTPGLESLICSVVVSRASYATVQRYGGWSAAMAACLDELGNSLD